MSDEDRDRWDDRYLDAPEAQPRPPVALPLSGLPLHLSGRALDIACGSGSVSVWLAQQGLDVLGVDISPVAVEAATALAGQHALAGSASFQAFDLDDGLPPGTFDVVVCQRFRDPARYSDIAAALAPGGVLVITVLSIVGNDSGPGPFRAAPGELVQAFGSRLDLLWSSEGNGEAHLVARRPPSTAHSDNSSRRVPSSAPS